MKRAFIKKVFSKENLLSAVLPLSVFYVECIVKIFIQKSFFDIRLLYIALFSLASGFLSEFIISLFKNGKSKRILRTVLLFLTSLICGIQFFCRRTFGVYFGLSVIFGTGAGAVKDFKNTLLNIIATGIFLIILLLLPGILYLIFGKKISCGEKRSFKRTSALLLAVVLFHGTALLIISASSEGIVTDKSYYTDRINITESSDRFGVLTGLRLDTQKLLLGGLYETDNSSGTGKINIETESVKETEAESETEWETETEAETEPEIIYSPNVMDIDFASLAESESNTTLAKMHRYFDTVTPTMQNKYTGMFEGKNLIYFTVESFSPYCISEELTPTLYKLTHEGFVFDNFYQPSWGVSTSDGEYTGLTGLVPESGLNSMYRSRYNNMYFTLGNRFSALGYKTLAYHNHSLTYYGRNETHPNLGYDFYAVGNGVEKYTEDVWPRSDYEMIKGSLPDYINEEHFHVYYMTVSGHGGYGRYGNSMSGRNWEAVENLPYSDKVKAYIAANIEFEKALRYLIVELDKAGKLDDTVIVFTNDHYPYGLDEDFEGNEVNYYEELAGKSLERNFELYKNSLVIWCADMVDTVEVEKPCYSLDILPTLLNLFGIEYDSRLLMGTDILSDSEALVLFRNYSWITEKGRYDATTNTFTLKAGEAIDDDYVDRICTIVRDKVDYSTLILEKNYYKVLFGNK